MEQRQKLPPLLMRRDSDPSYEPEIWQPDYSCFCCEDTGLAMHAA